VDINNVAVVTGNATTVNIELEPSGVGTGVIAGLVLDPSGRAVQSALVELSGPSGARQTRTDAEGRFELTNLPAGIGYSVAVTANGLIPETQRNIQLVAGERVNLRFNLSRELDGGGSISGVVRAPNGQPFPGATVRIVGGPAVGQSRTTSSAGQFNFTGLPGGVYSLQTSAPGFRVSRITVYVRPANGAFVIIRLRR
jgi:hypothetical protein